jgi:hypothetical protein
VPTYYHEHPDIVAEGQTKKQCDDKLASDWEKAIAAGANRVYAFHLLVTISFIWCAALNPCLSTTVQHTILRVG